MSSEKQFSWQLVEHTEMGMKVQLNFDNPQFISTSNSG